MMRLSAALTRRVAVLAASGAVDVVARGAVAVKARSLIVGDAVVFRAAPDERGTEPTGVEEALEESSSQTSMVNILWHQIMEGCCDKHQALLDRCGVKLLQPCIETRQKVHEYGGSGRHSFGVSPFAFTGRLRSRGCRSSRTSHRWQAQRLRLWPRARHWRPR